MAQENPKTTEPPIKEAKIVSPKERHLDVPIDWPVEFDGKTYDTIRVRRISGREVETFIRQVAAMTDQSPAVMPPTFDCPLEVYEAMDDDDRLRVEEAALPFMPRRLRAAAGAALQDISNS